MPKDAAHRPKIISFGFDEHAPIWRVLFQNAPDGLLLVDEDGTIRLANQRAATLFGHAETDLLGRPIEDLVPTDRRAAHVAARTAYAERPHARPMGTVDGLQGLRADGTVFPVDVSISPIQEDGSAYFFAAVRDRTEHHALVQELHRTTDALRRSNHDLEAFAARAAHDLRAPLSTIALTAATLSITWPEAPPELHDVCKRLARGVKALDAQVRGLLELSTPRRQDVRATWFLLGDALATVRENLRSQLEERGVELDVGDLPRVHAEKGLVEHVLQNLVANAVRHAHEPPRVRVHAEQVRGGVRVRVEDNGGGVPEDLREEVFQPFVRHESDGVGIGLALVRRIVDAHGGLLGVEDSELGGAAFWFTLPDRSSVLP